MNLDINGLISLSLVTLIVIFIAKNFNALILYVALDSLWLLFFQNIDTS